ncbi:MAG: ethanolamine ammonia-lyase subunit EutB [Deltaproteobacteria bacterium]|nr:ethanolamine ammonia-lyase subunit EutB [Deltaproteobacteria bacterium]
MNLSATVRGRHFTFPDLKTVLGKANELKSGDMLAGVAAENDTERVAARRVLAGIPLWYLRENPAVPYDEDEVTRLILDDADAAVFGQVAGWTVAELREHILSSEVNGESLLKLGRGLTSECIAAVAKLMTNLDLIRAAAKIRVVTHSNATLGLRGRFSVRLQPNHTTDDPAGILASAMEGLSWGSGDAIIGVNPVTDTVEATVAILNLLHEFTRTWNIPTQHCCLAHVTTQMEALRRGCPMDIMFQSLAGSEKSCRAFGISNAMLEEANAMVRELATSGGPNYMYFETGQGSELSSNGHNGFDQVVMEARCYGLARHFRPYMVNTVVGFIGPEYLFNGKQVARAGLEDHFMGKLHGLPMGCDVCYTNHIDADQYDLENLAVLLATAGVNFFMGLPMGDDVMLNYQSTSFHDNATIRELLGLRPTPEFERWMERMGLILNGKLTGLAGDMGVFLR